MCGPEAIRWYFGMELLSNSAYMCILDTDKGRPSHLCTTDGFNSFLTLLKTTKASVIGNLLQIDAMQKGKLANEKLQAALHQKVKAQYALERAELEAAEASVNSKADKSAIWSCVGEAMVIVKGDKPFEGAIMDFNPSLTKLSKGIALIGKLTGNTLQAVLQIKTSDIMEMKPEDTASAASYEFEITNEDGTVIACEATVASVITTPSDDMRTAVVIRDRTIQKQLEEQKHQTEIQKTKNATLQTHIKWVQHEVKNSALSLQARIQLIQHLISGFPPGLADYAQHSLRDDVIGLESEVNTLLNGVQDQVVFGCLASGTYIAQWLDVKTDDIVAKLLRHADQVNAQDKYTLECHGFSRHGICRLDTHALKHATYNFESNAFKYGVVGTLRVCMWMTDSKESWNESSSRFSRPSELRYKPVCHKEDHHEVCVVDNIGDMTPGSAVPLNGAARLYEDTHVSHMLCISFTNEVMPEQIPTLCALIAAGKLGHLFNDGVRSAWSRHFTEAYTFLCARCRFSCYCRG